jgi:hypothetical protein
MLGWDRYGYDKKRAKTCYAELVFLHPVDLRVTYYILVRLGRETSTHYFPGSGPIGMDMTKSGSGHVTPNLCFCIRWDLRVRLCIPMRPSQETSMHYFSCSGGTGTDMTKSASGTLC